MNCERTINIIAVYVDDILIACSSEKMLIRVKHQIGEQFDVVDKGPIDYFLGMEITRKDDTISISHKQFIREMLKEQGMAHTRQCHTPLDPGHKFQRCQDCSNCVLVDTKAF